MNPLNKILIQVPASEKPKEDRYYYTLVETLSASEVPALISFSNGQWLDNSMCTVTHYYRPASSIEEIKEMLGQQLFTKEDMENCVTENLETLLLKQTCQECGSNDGTFDYYIKSFNEWFNEKYPEYGK